MENINTILQNLLETREKEGLLRKLTSSESGVDFYSNDYLGLAKSASLNSFLQTFFEQFKLENPSFTNLGSTGSRLISGNHPIFEIFEKKSAEFQKTELALIFGLGF